MTRIIAIALLVSMTGCATTGPDAPQTTAETAGGAVGGIVGAAGGGTLGVLAGTVVGFQCGPAFFVCSPIMAVVYGVQGIAKGGELGAKTGVKLSRGTPDSGTPADRPQTPSPEITVEYSDI